MIRRVRHTGYTVGNLDRSVEFYCNILGMEVDWRRDQPADYLERIVGYPGAHLKVAHLRIPGDGHVLELMEYVKPVGVAQNVRERCNPGSHHICLLVQDIWAEYRRLKELGVELLSEPVAITSGANTGAFALYLIDPDGITCELFQAGQPG